MKSDRAVAVRWPPVLTVDWVAPDRFLRLPVPLPAEAGHPYPVRGDPILGEAAVEAVGAPVGPQTLTTIQIPDDNTQYEQFCIPNE